MNIPHHQHRWKKSSFSGQETDCVELAYVSGSPTRRLVRDSKNPDGPFLVVEMQALLNAMKTTG